MRTGWDFEVDRHAMIGFGIPADKNAPIIAAALDVKVRRAPCPRVFGNRVIPARRRKTHLKTQLTALPLGRIRLPCRIGKAGDKLVIIFAAQAVGNKPDHAHQAFGALVDGGLTTPAKQSFGPVQQKIPPELYNLKSARRCPISGHCGISRRGWRERQARWRDDRPLRGLFSTKTCCLQTSENLLAMMRAPTS